MPKIIFVLNHQAEPEYIQHKLNAMIIRGVRLAKENQDQSTYFENFVYNLTKEDDYWQLLRTTIIHKKFNARHNVAIAFNTLDKKYQAKHGIDKNLYIDILEVMKLYLNIKFRPIYHTTQESAKEQSSLQEEVIIKKLSDIAQIKINLNMTNPINNTPATLHKETKPDQSQFDSVTNGKTVSKDKTATDVKNQSKQKKRKHKSEKVYSETNRFTFHYHDSEKQKKRALPPSEPDGPQPQPQYVLNMYHSSSHN